MNSLDSFLISLNVKLYCMEFQDLDLNMLIIKPVSFYTENIKHVLAAIDLLIINNYTAD